MNIEKVKWQSGKIVRYGLWMDQKDDKFDEVMCIKAGDVQLALKCLVPREIIQKQ